MSEFDYKKEPLAACLMQYPLDVPELGYNGQYLMREAAERIEELEAEIARLNGELKNMKKARRWSEVIADRAAAMLTAKDDEIARLKDENADWEARCRAFHHATGAGI